MKDPPLQIMYNFTAILIESKFRKLADIAGLRLA
jgi:hypothetical protein